MSKQEKDKVLERVKSNTYKMALQVFGIFAGAGICGALFGKLIDDQFNTSPFGILGMLGLFYIAAWVGVIKINREMMAEIKQTRAEEAKPRKNKINKSKEK